MSDRAMRSNGSTCPTIPLLILAIGICVASFVSAQAGEPEESRLRSRALGIVVGSYTPGPLNAITDVAGVTVGQTTLISGDGPLKPGLGPIRTGVTVVIPRDDVWHKKVPAGSFVLNGTGEMTGLAWISESGFLEYPIALTNTLNVPRVANGVMSSKRTRWSKCSSARRAPRRRKTPRCSPPGPTAPARRVAMTTDAGGRWAKPWTGWDGYDKLFSQLVRWAMRPTGDTGDLHRRHRRSRRQHGVRRHGDRRRRRVPQQPVDDRRRRTPDMKTVEIRIEQVAPGRYVGSFPSEMAGSYLVVGESRARQGARSAPA